MRFLLRAILIGFISISAYNSVQAQKSSFLKEGISIRTNLFNLAAKRPTISIEKEFNNQLALELSYVTGKVENFLLTDYYRYKGVVVRGKKYFDNETLYIPFTTYPLITDIRFYLGAYTGILYRNIQTTGHNLGGWIGYPDRYFAANSIRFGGTFGVSKIASKEIVLDTQFSLGYGRYYNILTDNSSTYNSGYLDAQAWFSIGYILN